MTPAEFVAKWQCSTRAERAAAQEHFIDLCRMLGQPTPNDVGLVGARGVGPAVPTCRIVVPSWIVEAIRESRDRR